MLSRSPSRVKSSDLFSFGIYTDEADGQGLRSTSSCGALSISHDNDGLLRQRSYRNVHQAAAASNGESREFKAARNKTTLVVNAASVLEKTDEQLLPSVYKYVNCSFQAGPDKLGYITAGRAVCQALASGLGGYLGHEYDRRLVIAAGCFIWGIMTMMFSFSSSWQIGALLWFWNGLGLAFVIPNSQSLIADFFDDVNRGKAFGTLYTTGAIGAMLGTAFATNVAGLTVLGEEGWRFVFRTVAIIAMTIGWITLKFAADPNYLRAADGTMPPKHHNGSLRETIKEFMEVAKIPTFQVIILQGILGSTPWNALVFLTVYLQLIGFSDFNASLALSFFQAGAALGGVVGGAVGDWASKRSPNHGRIWACQFSVSMGIPFSLLLMKGLPQDGGPLAVMLHVLTLFVFGLVHVWAAPACNNPVFAEIVPPQMRNLVYAFDRSFEGALAALGAPLVGIIAHDFFNFPKNANTYDCLDGKPVEGTDIAATHGKAQSLGNAMLVCMLVPWLLCLTVYTGLHFTYPKDRQRAIKVAEELNSAAAASESSPFVPQSVAGGVPTQPEFSLDAT